MNELLLRAVDCLAAGAACALVAAGVVLSLVVRRPVNLSLLVAPGAAMLIGGAIGGSLGMASGSMRLALGAAAAVAICTVIWVVVDQVIERPLRSARPNQRLHALLAAAGVLLLALVVVERAAIRWPLALGDLLTATTPDPEQPAARPVVFDQLDAATIVSVAVTLSVVLLLMTRSKGGLAMRAVGYRPQTAALLGINTERLIAMAVVLSAAVVAMGGLLYGVRQGTLDAMSLVRPGIVAGVALMVAGLKRPLLTVAAAAALGTIEGYVWLHWPDGAAARDAVLVLIAVAAMLVWPAEWLDGDGVAAA